MGIGHSRYIAASRQCATSLPLQNQLAYLEMRTEVLSRVLILEHPVVDPRLNDLGFLDTKVQCERIARDWFVKRCKVRQQLVLANATSITEAVVLFFNWLRTNRIPISIIVILPEFADRQFCAPYRKLPMISCLAAARC